MGKVLAFIALLVALPLSLRFWVKRLKSLWENITVIQAKNTRDQSDTEMEELVTTARLSFYSDLFLALLCTGLIIYFTISLSTQALEGLANYFTELATALNAYKPLSEGGQMETLTNAAIRVLLSIGAFLIVFGLSVAFLPGIFPQEKGSRLSNYLSYGTAFFLAAVFSLWLGTSKTAFGIVIDQLTRGFLGIITTFLSILFGAIGTYLLWKRIKSLIKPK